MDPSYLIFGGVLALCFGLLCYLNTMRATEFFAVQIPAHIYGGFFGTGAWIVLMRRGFHDAICLSGAYLVYTIPMIVFFGFPVRQIWFRQDTNHEKIASNRRKTREYWNSALAGGIEHLFYFWVFLMRQRHATTEDMRRPLEQEFTFLINSYVKPFFPDIEVQTLLESYVERQSEAINTFADACLRPRAFGVEFWWYQMFEGINHGLVVLGSLFIVFQGSGRDVVAEANARGRSWIVWIVVVCYEYGILCELFLYGPQYFWMLNWNLYNAIFDSPHPSETAEYRALIAISTWVCVTHHTGYWIDTWSSLEALRAWGWAESSPELSCNEGSTDDARKSRSITHNIITCEKIESPNTSVARARSTSSAGLTQRIPATIG